MKFFSYLFFCSIALFLGSCQKPFDNSSINSSQKSLVVDGRITNDSGPYVVKLSYSIPFNGSNYSANEVKEARVIIKDNLGNREVLKEISDGYYITDTFGIKGTVGRTYTLSIVTSQGDVYESSPSLMNAPVVVDDIYAQIGTSTKSFTNGNGDVTTTKEDGLNIYMNFSSDSKNIFFIRINSEVITERTYVNLTGPPATVFMWSVGDLENLPDVKSSEKGAAGNMIKNHEIGFLGYIKADTPVEKNSSAPEMAGWIVISKIYTLSGEAYTYYKGLSNQLSATNAIFDPFPTQLTGNIKCLSDTTKKAFGFFEVSSRTSKYAAFSWSPGVKKYHRTLLDFVPDTIQNGRSGEQPPFWAY